MEGRFGKNLFHQFYLVIPKVHNGTFFPANDGTQPLNSTSSPSSCYTR